MKVGTFILSKKVSVIAWFEKDGTVNPIKIKLEENDEIKVIKVSRVIKREYEKLVGNHMWKFTCVSLVDGVEIQYILKYDLLDCRWLMFM